VGWNVEVIDGDNHSSCNVVSNRILHKTCDEKDEHPCVTTKEDGHLGTIALVDHNLIDQQTNSYPKLPKDTQFQ